MNLWPYALRMACDAFNNAPLTSNETGLSPLQLITKTSINMNWTHWHTFGAPVYPLLPQLQQEPRIMQKWSSRIRPHPCINLEHSPLHARNVLLVLDTQTGYTSPQFHVTVDDEFTTVNPALIYDKWQVAAGFKAKSHEQST